MQRFFDDLDSFCNAVLNGVPIDCTAGYTDGDHFSWLLETLGADDIGLARLAYEFSERVTTVEQAQNAKRYLSELFAKTLAFNMIECGSRAIDHDSALAIADAL